jgi:hypothetical protein
LVHATEAALREHFVGFGGERLIAEKEGFHRRLLSYFIFKVNHIDVSRPGIVISVKQFDVFLFNFATGDLHGFLRTCLAP